MRLSDLSLAKLWAFAALAFVYGTGITLTTANIAVVFLSASG